MRGNSGQQLLLWFLLDKIGQAEQAGLESASLNDLSGPRVWGLSPADWYLALLWLGEGNSGLECERPSKEGSWNRLWIGWFTYKRLLPGELFAHQKLASPGRDNPFGVS